MRKALYLPPAMFLRGDDQEFVLSVITADGQFQSRSFQRGIGADVADLQELHDAIGRWIDGGKVVP